MAGNGAERVEGRSCVDPCNLSPQDQKELTRQKEILNAVFSVPQYTSDPKRVSILTGIEIVVVAVCQGERPIEDFSRFRDSVINLPEYAFLSDAYPGLNVNGWRIFLAKIDPLTYGRQIHRTSKGTSGKRI